MPYPDQLFDSVSLFGPESVMPLASRQRYIRDCATGAIAFEFVAAPWTAIVHGAAVQARTRAGTENRMRNVSARERALASILPCHIDPLLVPHPVCHGTAAKKSRRIRSRCRP